jgi:S1-C subfamily serine protease
MRPALAFALVTSLAAGLWATAARADELAEKGRAIFKQHQRAVVTVQVVMKAKMSFGGMGDQGNESKQDLTGTVIDPSGLTVLALSATDPTSVIRSLLGGMGDEDMKFKFDTELTDVKILLEDGTELPAEVVLRDKDLDLAFIRPKTKPAQPMPAVDLANAGQADVLDQVITLNRLGKAAGRAYAASVERISAVVQKPRLFYVPESTATATALGSPAFLPDGKILGICVMRAVSSDGGGMGLFSLQPQGLTGIILPAADVLKVAKQAPEAKGDAAKPAEKKTDSGPEKTSNPQ